MCARLEMKDEIYTFMLSTKHIVNIYKMANAYGL